MNNIQNISLGAIKPDPRNPRKKFDDAAINELADNIAQQGLLQPITVRPIADGYSIVCGERRYRAFKELSNRKGGRAITIPAIVREMDDNEAFDAMITENLIRKDVNPAEEGRAFLELKKRMDVKDIAIRFGKSEQFVRQRLQLASLIPHFVKLIEDELLPVSYALALSRFSFELQRDIFDDCFQSQDNYPRSLKALIEYIDRKYLMYMSKAVFDPKAGDKPCSRCTFNTANQGLFDEYKGEEARCTQRDCFTKKQEDATISIAKEMHRAGYVIILQDTQATASMRERLDTMRIGYSCNDYRFRTDIKEPGDSEAKAVLLYNYRGFVYEEGVVMLPKPIAEHTETSVDKILSLKREDDNNKRILEDNINKELRAYLSNSELYKERHERVRNISSIQYAIMVMDLPTHMREYLGFNVSCYGPGSIEVFEKCKNLDGGQKTAIEFCWVQSKLFAQSVMHDGCMSACLNKLVQVAYSDDHAEIIGRHRAAYDQKKERIDAKFNNLGLSITDVTQEMIDEYDRSRGKTDDGKYQKAKKEYIKIVSRVTKDNANRLADIQRKYGFKSNYEISQYLMHCFLRVADPDNDPILEPVPEEIVEMFGGLSDHGAMRFEKPKRRIPTNKAE